MGRRSKLEITINVLEVIQKGESKPSRIMHSANISWNKLNEILDSLISQGLVTKTDTKEPRRKRDKRSNIGYITTPKGQGVLRRFRTRPIETEELNLFRLT